MEEPEQTAPQQPAAERRRDRLRAFMTPGTMPTRSHTSSDMNHRSRLHAPVHSLMRRLTSRRSARAGQSDDDSLTSAIGESEVVPSFRRGLRFRNRSGAPDHTPRFSYIHQQTVTTISARQDQESPAAAVHDEVSETQRVGQPRRRRMSVQMSDFFSNVTSPRNRAASRTGRSRVVSAIEPLGDLDLLDQRPPTPAEVRRNSLEDADAGADSDYERGFTPRRRRVRPQPVVGEPHDEDYVRRRNETQSRRATWGPTAFASVPENSSSDSISLFPRRRLDRPSPMSSSSAITPPLTTVSRPQSSLISRTISHSSVPSSPPEAVEIQPTLSTAPTTGGARRTARSVQSILRPAIALRNLARSRRSSSRESDWAAGQNMEGRIPLAELQRLLASYASRSSADSDYHGHQETTVDGGTITIYGIRRVNARAGDDEDGGGLFSALTRETTLRQDQEREASPRPRARPRRPRRIFNFIGLNELEPLPQEIEETFDRLRRARRPRSMFGSGSLRRNGVVEPDVASPEGNAQNSEDSGATGDNDETWIFYIVSAVLPEGHPLLSAPSLFTDNPTYEDMLFLDSFLQKPVANRADLAAARGLYTIHRRSNGNLYASAQDDAEDISITTERCLICLADFEETEEVRKLAKCEHLFHRECVDTWLTKGRNSCPLCRGEGVEKKNKSRTPRGTIAGPSTTGPASLNVI